ncbi:MAG: GIY-YIG nuclease family protein [Verrucomicrobia bacterium]|nr:GIY-YIG nuclease family protein [Verrucomicrobiota bacterium]MBT7065165.1 GIY-YIG nuclease family protein [Verrucomicrobiota bacterium]MBT7700673.1 GIY-YIG nuclease family protein [Verrucomicrobiota bacterium]
MRSSDPKPHYVYILWSETGLCFYKGVTVDIPHRLAQHNGGESKWTKRHAGTWRLVWHREFPSLGDARKFENRLKKQKGGKGFWGLTGLDPECFGSPSGS